jgi:hypothetical protein
MSEVRKVGQLNALMAGGLALSLIGCAVFAYLWVDRSLSLSYMDSSQRSSAQGYAQLADLVGQEWAGLPESEVLKRLQAAAARHPQESIVVKHDPSEGVIWFGSTRFEFQSGRLQSVR